ncbi:LysR family transcriptional regulator [Variovorax boronicumulans]|uniref:LysR family transcriptional regulator n=1 Tax=Variovorax boronicumulans TaxID=436515 RepID=UPI00339376E1
MIDLLTLSQMQMFAVVAEARSFRAGAARLHRVQSAVSHAIANLEAQLQVRLFDRSGHKPVLTPAGQTLLGDVRVILAKVQALRTRAHGLEQGIELELSIAVDTLVPPAWVAEAVRGLNAVYPSIAIRVEYSSMGGTIDALYAGRCDVAVASFGYADEKISREHLVSLRMVTVAAPSHALAALARRRSAAKALDAAAAEHVQIVVQDPSALSEGLDFDVLSLTTWRVNDMHIKLALLRAGLGWGKMPSWLVADDLAAGTLVRLPVGRIGPGGETAHEAYFCHSADRPLGAGATLLRDCLMAHAKTAAHDGGGATPTRSARRSPR